MPPGRCAAIEELLTRSANPLSAAAAISCETKCMSFMRRVAESLAPPSQVTSTPPLCARRDRQCDTVLESVTTPVTDAARFAVMNSCIMRLATADRLAVAAVAVTVLLPRHLWSSGPAGAVLSPGAVAFVWFRGAPTAERPPSTGTVAPTL
jgi:hypothetical protein